MNPNNNPTPQPMEGATGAETPPVETTVDELRRQISALEQSLEAAEGRFLRSQAELDNSRKRMRREMEDERRYAALPLLRDLLNVVDNLNRALESAQQTSAEAAPLVTGVRMVVHEFHNILEKNHCRKIVAAGMPFDPNYHSAIGQVPSGEYAPGTVVQVVLDGYQLHDRVVRPAQVLIAAPPADQGIQENPNPR